MTLRPYNSPTEADLQGTQSFSNWANDLNINAGPSKTTASMNGTAQLAATSYSVSDILQGTFNVKNPADPLLIINNALTQDLGFLNSNGYLQSNARLSGGYTGGMNTNPAGTAYGGVPTIEPNDGPVGGIADGDGIVGAVTETQVLALPTEHSVTHAKIWQKRGKSSLEMHLGITNPDSKIPPKTGDGHLQLASLAPDLKYPYYMDRVGGWRGGEDYTKGDVTTSTIAQEDPSLPGATGAFGVLLPEEEQFYCSMPWPINNTAVKNKFIKAGLPEIATYAEEWDLKHANYRRKRVLVYSVITKKACVCTPGDWGPNPNDSTGSTSKDSHSGFIIGLSPDVHQVLGHFAPPLSGPHGQEVIVGWVDDSTPLGAYNPQGLNDGSSGLGNTTGAAKAIAWGETQIGAKYAAVSPFRYGEPPWPGGTVGGYGPFPTGSIVYDCSGFVVACWRKAGIDFSRYSIGSSWQFDDKRIPDAPLNDLKPGDVVVYHPPAGSSIGHVVLIHHKEANGYKTLESSGGHGVWIGNLMTSRIRCCKRPALMLAVSDSSGVRNV